MSSNNSATRPAYKVEELLALRGSASESAVSLEKFPDEDVIKEHVLKPSASNPGLSASGENVRPFLININVGPRAVSAPRVGPFMVSAIKRPSPTPSVKRNKAEKLIKEHGSPPNVRVTAGGRIVPNDFTPLGSPRFPYVPMHRPNVPSLIKFPTRNAPLPNFEPTLPNGYVAYNVYGDLCQSVDGKWLPVRPGPSGQPALFMTPPNWPFPPIGTYVAANPASAVSDAIPATALYPPTVAPPSLSTQTAPPELNAHGSDIDTQIKALQDRYEAKRQQKIRFEQDEVKLGDTVPPSQRTEIVAQKRQFVIDLDAIRKKIKELEGVKDGTNTAGAFPTPIYMNPADTVPYFSGVPAISQPMNAALPGAQVPQWAAFPPTSAPTVNGHDQAQDKEEHSPPSESSPSSRIPRRSHAIPIKDPRTHQPVAEQNSSLNPASPSYEPGKPFPLTDGSPPAFVVPAPSPIETPNPPPAELAKQYPWVFENDNNGIELPQKTELAQPARMPSSHSQTGTMMNEHEYKSRTPSQHQTSQSSVTTTDFFPINTHEHSFGKYMSRKASGAATLAQENNPCTPHRDIHADLVSPMSAQQHSKAPPVSPIDLRMSSFLRDTALTPARMSESSYVKSPIRPEIREEFNGKSKSYLEGYVAASAGNAPTGKSPDYVEGYCDGLKSTSAMRLSDSRSTSTISLKSDSVSTSKTPPNTANNRSNASIGDNHQMQYENIRLTQSATFLPPINSSFGQQSPGSTVPLNHQAASSFPQEQSKRFSQFSAKNNFSQFSHSFSELDGSSWSPKATELPAETPWNVSLKNHLHQESTVAATTIPASAVPQRRERMVSTSLNNKPPTLTGHSGNQYRLTARVSTIPQFTYFDDDKYNGSNEPRKMDSKATQAGRSRDWSYHSQVDGAMDDLAEMTEPTAPAPPPKNAGNAHPRGPKRASYTLPDPAISTPPASPSKSGSSPKKLASPKHRIQQLASHARDFLGSGSSCGSDRGDRNRSESPDPKKMSPEEKRHWKDEWKMRFREMKNKEAKAIEKYKKDNPL